MVPLGRGVPGVPAGRHHGQVSETGCGQRPFRLFPGKGCEALEEQHGLREGYRASVVGYRMLGAGR